VATLNFFPGKLMIRFPDRGETHFGQRNDKIRAGPVGN
jgi:hypothetical protein